MLRETFPAILSSKSVTTFSLLVMMICYVFLNYYIRNDTIKYDPLPRSHLTLSPSLAYKTSSKPTPLADEVIKSTKNTSSLIYNYNKTYTTVMYYNEIWGRAPKPNLKKCQYKNCILTANKANVEKQSAILFFIPYMMCKLRKPPIKRNPDQVWIFVWHETAVHLCKQPLYNNVYWKNMVNWTMSFEYEADIYFPFGQIKKNEEQNKAVQGLFNKKTRMAAWVVSHCNAESKRDVYVKELQKHGVQVDIYGRCAGKRVDRAQIRKKITEEYKFYLAFENSFCVDYITEKFYSYYELDVIIVARGGGNYSRLLPPKSFINAADFASARDLAEHILKVANNETLFNEYMVNKNKFSAYSEQWNDGFCEICQKLNHLDKNGRTYSNLHERMHKDKCFKPSDLEIKPIKRDNVSEIENKTGVISSNV